MRLVGSENKSTVARRREILGAALDVFNARGFFDATLDHVCAKASLSKGSLYHYYDSKEALAVAIYLDALRDLQMAMYISPTEGARSGIEQAVGGYLDWHFTNPARGAFLSHAPSWSYSSTIAAPIRAQQERFMEHAGRWFGHWIRHRAFRKLPLNLYEPLIIGPSRDFVERWSHKPKPSELRRMRPFLIEAAWIAIAR